MDLAVDRLNVIAPRRWAAFDQHLAHSLAEALGTREKSVKSPGFDMLRELAPAAKGTTAEKASRLVLVFAIRGAPRAGQGEGLAWIIVSTNLIFACTLLPVVQIRSSLSNFWLRV